MSPIDRIRAIYRAWLWSKPEDRYSTLRDLALHAGVAVILVVLIISRGCKGV